MQMHTQENKKGFKDDGLEMDLNGCKMDLNEFEIDVKWI